MFHNLQGRILKVGDARVWRTYTGGKEICAWHNQPEQQDTNHPEDWVASTVQAVNLGRESIVEGLSRVLNHPNQPTLKEVLESAPEAWFGQAHIAQLGAQTGVLVKLIDSAERLTIQVHPDKQFAKTLFHSDYGKTESWYILGGRSIDGQAPSIYFGFKPGVTREMWREVFEQQDIPRMLACLHKIAVKPGDTFFIEGGIPHAIGAGCFLAEVQEPTDLTLRTELVTPGGLRIHEKQCHQGVGFDQMLDCFHYDCFSLEETLARWQMSPIILEQGDGYCVQSLIDERCTQLFGMRSIQVSSCCSYQKLPRLTSWIVVAGEGTFSTEREMISVKQGDYLVVPASIENLQIQCTGTPLHFVESLPPVLGK